MTNETRERSALTFSNSCLATAADCPAKYALKYDRRLEAITDTPEALAVGSAWHGFHEEVARRRSEGSDVGRALAEGFRALKRTSPNPLWEVKLSRLAAAYPWHYGGEPLNVIESEVQFRVPLTSTALDLANAAEFDIVGSIDAVVENERGARGILEYKTTSEALDRSYFDRLGLDRQVGIYGLASSYDDGLRGLLPRGPEFILYDVTRKPTISPKKIPKKELDTMVRAGERRGAVSYYGEEFPLERVRIALGDGQESPALYGARLTADIGDRPAFYFQRREVFRTQGDYDRLAQDVIAQASEIVRRSAADGRAWRNPDACARFGRCEFHGVCWSGSVDAVLAGEEIPRGFQVRDTRHPELGY